MTTSAEEYEVAVVGYGPTGVVAANLLGAAGIRTVVVERSPDVYARARAVTVDGWTMRIFQSLGLDAAAKAEMDVTPALRWRTYAGHEILRTAVSAGEHGHDGSYMIFQPRLEATLRAGVDRYAHVVERRVGETFTELTQDGDGVDLTTRTDGGAQARYRARYVIAADGGSSQVRQSLGIALEGSTRARLWIVVDAKVRRWWPERQLLTFWSDPVRPVVDIPLALDHHRWEIPLGPDERREDFESESAIWALLSPLGVTGDDVEILHHAFYSHHQRQATTWARGRVFLTGDAAHMMPPWAGQGMQSGMRDAVNLVWKLRAVLRRDVDAAILATYQPERQPNVTALTNLSAAMGKLIEVESGPARLVRDRVLPVVSKLSIGRPRPVTANLAAGFLTGSPGPRSAVGRLVPQPMVAGADGIRTRFDAVLGEEFTVVGLDVNPDEVLSAGQRQAWSSVGARTVVLRSAQQRSRGNDVTDFQDVLGPWFRRYRTRVVVLRPDRYVAASEPQGLDLPQVGVPT